MTKSSPGRILADFEASAAAHAKVAEFGLEGLLQDRLVAQVMQSYRVNRHEVIDMLERQLQMLKSAAKDLKKRLGADE
jgi:DNA polymerase III psi subunit